jgi:hypothetical protein
MIRQFKFYIQKFLRLFGININVYYPRGFIQFIHQFKYGKYLKGKELTGAEVGVWEAENALNILKHLPIKKLYLIDPYQNTKEYEKSIGGTENKSDQKLLDTAKITAKLRLKPYEDKIVWIHKFSDEAYKDIKGKLDFVYIDGNHDSKFVKKDIKNYYPLLKKKGILSGHDFRIPGVFYPVVDFIKANNLKYDIIDEDWITVKK